ncbi:four helix bundle protein [Patescibacteria group bacterium]|nr:four helix bundle protein [Patescibacteria group bacterium]
MSKRFLDLRIWQEGYDLLLKIYEITTHFPNHEKYSLTSQITRSANSVIANIAESHGRYYFADKIRVLYLARAELEETQSHLRVAYGLNYINKEKYNQLFNRYDGLRIGINMYIHSLRISKMSKLH